MSPPPPPQSSHPASYPASSPASSYPAEEHPVYQEQTGTSDSISSTKRTKGSNGKGYGNEHNVNDHTSSTNTDSDTMSFHHLPSHPHHHRSPSPSPSRLLNLQVQARTVRTTTTACPVASMLSSTTTTPAPSPLPVIPSTSSSPLIPHGPAALPLATYTSQPPPPRSRSNSSSSSSALSSTSAGTSTSTSTSTRPSLLQRRASRSLSLSLPTSPLLMDPTDAPMLVSPSLYPPSLVANNLYLGSQHSLRYLKAGLCASVSSATTAPVSIAVLNVAEELPPLSPRTATANRATHYLHIPMSHAPNLADHLPSALAFIDTHLLAGRPVLVHCMCGVSRSAAVVLAYLMWKAKWGFRTAYEHVKARRNISPNMHLVCQLVEFAMDLENDHHHDTMALPSSSSSSSPDRNQPTDSTAALLAANASHSVAVAAEHQHPLSNGHGPSHDHDAMDVDQPPPAPSLLMDHVAQVMLVATTAAHVRAASHPESTTSSPPDTPCSYMTAFTSLPTPLGQDAFATGVIPETPLTADGLPLDSPMSFASPARPIRRLSAATISTTSLALPGSPATAASPATPAAMAAARLTPPRLASGRNPSISSISSMTSSISTHTSLVSPQSAMLDAFPLTDPDLMAATRAGPQTASAKAAAQAAVAAAAAVASASASPLGTPRTPAGMSPLASNPSAGNRPRSRSNPNIPTSYPGVLAAMDEVDEPVPALPVAFQSTTPHTQVQSPVPVPAAARPPAPGGMVLGKPPMPAKLKRGTPPPRINTSNLATSGTAAAAPVSAPAVSHPPRLPFVAAPGTEDVPPVPPLPPASAYPTSAATTPAPPPLPAFLAIPPELDVRPLFPLASPVGATAASAAPLAHAPLAPPTPTTYSFSAPASAAIGGSVVVSKPPMKRPGPFHAPGLGGGATGNGNALRKLGPGGAPPGASSMRLQAARGSATPAGLPALPPTPLGVGGADECPTPSGLGFKGFFRDEDDKDRDEEHADDGGYPWPEALSGGESDAMDVCK